MKEGKTRDYYDGYIDAMKRSREMAAYDFTLPEKSPADKFSQLMNDIQQEITNAIMRKRL